MLYNSLSHIKMTNKKTQLPTSLLISPIFFHLRFFSCYLSLYFNFFLIHSIDCFVSNGKTWHHPSTQPVSDFSVSFKSVLFPPIPTLIIHIILLSLFYFLFFLPFQIVRLSLPVAILLLFLSEKLTYIPLSRGHYCNIGWYYYKSLPVSIWTLLLLSC